MHNILVSVLATSLVAVIGAVAIEAPSQALAAPLGYGLETLSWNVTSTAGTQVILEGTVQEVYAQLLEINPEYESEFGILDDKVANLASEKEEGSALAKRGDVHCGIFATCAKRTIQEGVYYLRSIRNAQPTLGPGPGNCVRVSCSWNAGIFWCNDNTFEKVLPGYYNIADGAQEIIDRCPDANGFFAGQDFIGGARDWNVVVSYSPC